MVNNNNRQGKEAKETAKDWVLTAFANKDAINVSADSQNDSNAVKERMTSPEKPSSESIESAYVAESHLGKKKEEIRKDEQGTDKPPDSKGGTVEEEGEETQSINMGQHMKDEHQGDQFEEALGETMHETIENNKGNGRTNVEDKQMENS
ncbi:hypothetical protein K7X08_032584 [Anisodus acutangulus]|uniref:Uncharacterized protein n=1 Tax=Anisodus acutangulus TaxID=402998 RepID=A0A9Q1RR31_9SOLA|nr:hypothetical protein K7X08_032584 [Anisodus acutangulus]